MKKKDTQKMIERHDLSPLIRDLEILEQGSGETPETGTMPRYWFFLVCLGLVIGLFCFSQLSLETIQEQLTKSVKQDLSPSFNWTEKAFVDLDMEMIEDEVVAIYGPAQEREVYPETDSVILTYQFNDPISVTPKSVKLTFSGQLVAKFSYGLETDVVSPLQDPSRVHLFTEAEVDALWVGDRSTGQGGVSLTEVLDHYGQPTEVVSSLYEQVPSAYSSKSGLERTLFLSYRQPEEAYHDWVNLTFRAMGQGELYLAAKETE